MIDKSIFKEKKISPAIFRVVIGVFLLIDVVSYFFYGEEIYNAKGFSYVSDSSIPIIGLIREYISVFFALYALSLVAWILGLGRKFMSALVFLFFLLEYFLIQPYAVWGDEILRVSLFYFIFIDSFYVFSVKRYGEQTFILSKWAIYAIMLHLCYIYISNAYFKIQNIEWQSGYAIAYFFKSAEGLDVFSIKDIFMKSSLLIRVSTWLILTYQIIFPFLIWFKKIRIPLLIFGIITHFFMGFVLQAYKFEMIVMLHFAFFITDEEWNYMLKKMKIPTFAIK